MNRRERMENRLQRRLDWAESRDRKADAAQSKVHSIADNIPFGQPILVGHHSEAHARRDQERIQNGMSQCVESSRMAEHHRSKADGIQHQLDHSIFSDDSDAEERIEDRIAFLEAKREQRKAINKTYKASGIEAVRAVYGDEAALNVSRNMAACSWEKVPFPPYALTNLGANIRRLKERLISIERETKAQDACEAAGGITISAGTEYVNVRFSEKPDRAILDDLKAAGFSWCGGSWGGYRAKLPESVVKMQEALTK